jgi:hypothetical protein
MAKITLEINDKYINTFMTIVSNLKDGIVDSIEIDKKKNYNKPKMISKEPLEPINIKGKYIDPKTFKERLKRMK